jgi:hypothetical protein
VKGIKKEFKEYKESEECKERSEEKPVAAKKADLSRRSPADAGEVGRSSGKTRRMRCQGHKQMM